MTDNDLIRLFLPIITTGLTSDGYTGVSVLQSNQPTQQGTVSAPVVYFFKVSDKRYGFLNRSNIWDGTEMIHTEEQVYETTFQIMALVRQNPMITNSYTASDLVNEVASIMQSDATRQTLIDAGVGILRVMELRNPYFTDDQDIFEASPSFDFTLTYNQSRESTVEIIEPTIKSIFARV